MGIAIIYASRSGNTKETAELIQDECEKYIGNRVPLVSVTDLRAVEEVCQHSTLLFFGTYTWGKGKLPDIARKALRFMIKENDFALPPVAVFGTGETIFTYYCRAVDEAAYHLAHKTEVLGTMKIELAPRGPKAINVVRQFTRAIIDDWMEGYKSGIKENQNTGT